MPPTAPMHPTSHAAMAPMHAAQPNNKNISFDPYMRPVETAGIIDGAAQAHNLAPKRTFVKEDTGQRVMCTTVNGTKCVKSGISKLWTMGAGRSKSAGPETREFIQTVKDIASAPQMMDDGDAVGYMLIKKGVPLPQVYYDGFQVFRMGKNGQTEAVPCPTLDNIPRCPVNWDEAIAAVDPVHAHTLPGLDLGPTEDDVRSWRAD